MSELTEQQVNDEARRCVELLDRRWTASRYADFDASCRIFVRRGARLCDVADAIDVTQLRGRGNYWAYFCGVMWKKIKSKATAGVAEGVQR